VAKFFAAPSRGRNAAPLYLDALFEFGAEMAACYPEGPERERRRQAALDRSKRYMEVIKPLQDKPDAADLAVVDEVIKLYDTGFRKLADAHRRDQCVFETGFSVTTLLPHAQVARMVARIASLRIQRAVQRGDFEAAIRDVETVLRIVRDLQPRGFMITQLVASAITQFVGANMVPAILSAPSLRVAHCDQLLKVLTSHEQKSTDGYADGLRAEYLTSRSTLRDLVLHQRELARRLNLKPGDSVVKASLQPMVAALAPGSAALAAGPGRDARSTLPDDADAQLARTAPAELARRERQMDRYYRELLALDGVPYSERLQKMAGVGIPPGQDPLSLTAGYLMPAVEAFALGIMRARATVSATECLVALRRWQLTHRGAPRNLVVAARDARLKAVPVDPYDGKPMRLAAVGGELIVYSVGKDGRDDGGQKDSKFDMQPGDLLYRLPAVEKRRGIRP
jgi:hypothetical protein